ncbi:MAG: hypothetical protein JST21_02500 [Bacteroidetes bacterium]|nr:hypothetical protein [Bacteroidota bacterium]
MLMLTFPQQEVKWLPATLLNIQELVYYLTQKNDNVMVYVKKINIDVKSNGKVYEMSNGLHYSTKGRGQWFIVEN